MKLIVLIKIILNRLQMSNDKIASYKKILNLDFDSKNFIIYYFILFGYIIFVKYNVYKSGFGIEIFHFVTFSDILTFPFRYFWITLSFALITFIYLLFRLPKDFRKPSFTIFHMTFLLILIMTFMQIIISIVPSKYPYPRYSNIKLKNKEVVEGYLKDSFSSYSIIILNARTDSMKTLIIPNSEIDYIEYDYEKF